MYRKSESSIYTIFIAAHLFLTRCHLREQVKAGTIKFIQLYSTQGAFNSSYRCSQLLKTCSRDHNKNLKGGLRRNFS